VKATIDPLGTGVEECKSLKEEKKKHGNIE